MRKNVIGDRMEYYERLLCLQFIASDNIEHKLTKGELREKFINNLVSELLNSQCFRNGILSDYSSGWQSTQADFIKLAEDSTFHESLYSVHDCLIFMEVKSHATSAEINHLNEISELMKSHKEDIITGMFCYETRASEKTIAKNFGLYFDNDIEGYTEFRRENDKYPFVDFLFSLDIHNPFSLDTSCYFLDRTEQNVQIYKGPEGIAISRLIDKLKYKGASR